VSREKAKERLVFFSDALEYGAPPHGGIAPGVDRIVMISRVRIRSETDRVPKTQKATSLMDDAPSPADPNS